MPNSERNASAAPRRRAPRAKLALGDGERGEGFQREGDGPAIAESPCGLEALAEALRGLSRNRPGGGGDADGPLDDAGKPGISQAPCTGRERPRRGPGNPRSGARRWPACPGPCGTGEEALVAEAFGNGLALAEEGGGFLELAPIELIEDKVDRRWRRYPSRCRVRCGWIEGLGAEGVALLDAVREPCEAAGDAEAGGALGGPARLAGWARMLVRSSRPSTRRLRISQKRARATARLRPRGARPSISMLESRA